MLHYLGGGTRHSASEFYGKTIASAAMENDRLKLSFTDGTLIEIWDDCQSCCEHRYMTCDDDLAKIIGGNLIRMDVKAGPEIKCKYGYEHEILFVEVATNECFITIATHNEHNGYYGGFGLTIDIVTPSTELSGAR